MGLLEGDTEVLSGLEENELHEGANMNLFQELQNGKFSIKQNEVTVGLQNGRRNTQVLDVLLIPVVIPIIFPQHDFQVCYLDHDDLPQVGHKVGSHQHMKLFTRVSLRTSNHILLCRLPLCTSLVLL